jgi:hypothetical protein
LIIRRTRATPATTGIGRTSARAHADKKSSPVTTAAETTETRRTRARRMDAAATAATIINIAAGDRRNQTDAAVTGIGRRVAAHAAGAAATAALEAAGTNAITKSARESLGTRRRRPTR